MTQNELKLCSHIWELMTIIGKLEGTLMAVQCWNIPKELKEKLKNQKIEVPKFPEIYKHE